MTGSVAALLTTLGGGGILAFIGLLLQVRSLNKKLNTESAQIITKTATDLLQTINSELNDAQIEIKDLRLQVKDLMSQLNTATIQAEKLTSDYTASQNKARYFETEYLRLISKGV